MKTKIVLALALVVPTAATAQTIRTDCYSHRGNYHCQSTITPSLGQTIADLARMNRERQEEQLEAVRAANLAKWQEQERLKALNPATQSPEFQEFRIVDLLGGGDCAGARRYALATTKPELLKRVEESCGK